ncbi:hypothetical protein JNUCC0626_48205 [Lentzea sp. JNUCC 0626]|uniref:hypothetical protein n=1 Tax=Lentzea sp. JNUCC 0626 TaxID=3367513 RepID=UPI0037484D8E
MHRHASLGISTLLFSAAALAGFTPAASAAGPALQVMAPQAARSVSVQVTSCGDTACQESRQCGTLGAHAGNAWTAVDKVTLYQGSRITVAGFSSASCGGAGNTAQRSADVGAAQQTAVRVNLT